MKHISLDGEARTVKKFIRSLATEPGGSILELDGKAVLKVLGAG